MQQRILASFMTSKTYKQNTIEEADVRQRVA